MGCLEYGNVSCRMVRYAASAFDTTEPSARLAQKPEPCWLAGCYTCRAFRPSIRCMALPA